MEKEASTGINAAKKTNYESSVDAGFFDNVTMPLNGKQDDKIVMIDSTGQAKA